MNKSLLTFVVIVFSLAIAAIGQNSIVFSKNSTVNTAAFLIGASPDSSVSFEILQRSLDTPIKGVPSPRLVDEMVHYQVVIRDSSGKIIDTYGWSGKDGGKIIDKEEIARINTDYDSKSRAQITMSYRDAVATRKEIENYLSHHGYELTNGGIFNYRNPSADGNLNCQYASYKAYEFATRKLSSKIVVPFAWPSDETGIVNFDNIPKPLPSPVNDNTTEKDVWPHHYPVPHPQPNPGPYPQPDPTPYPKDDDRDILDSIEEFSETLEGIVDERRDMRDERRKRKEEKRRKEQERKQLEEERLRQQQLEEQRKKKDAQKGQKKNSDKKQDVKKDVKKAEPKKDAPAPASPSDNIDFSKLNSLISQQASFLRGIISSGKKATSAQHSQFNSLNNQYVSEFNRLKARIGNISDSAKRSQYYSQLASINSRMNSEVDPLLAQGQRQGLFTNL